MAKEGADEARVYSNYTIGIISIVLALISSWGIGGIALGIIGLVRSKKDKGELSKKAKRLNLIGLLIGIVVFVLYLIASLVIGLNSINAGSA